MLVAHQKFSSELKTTADLKAVLEIIWDNLHQFSIDKAILGFLKRLRAYVKVDGGNFERIF